MEEERQPIEYGYGRSSTLYQDYDYEKNRQIYFKRRNE